MFTFLTNYRDAVKESINNRSYAEAVCRVVLFPFVYGAAVATDILYNATEGKNESKVSSVTIVKEVQNVELSDEQKEALGKLFEAAIEEVRRTGKPVTLGEIMKSKKVA